MKKLLKILLGLVGAIVIVFLVAAIALPLLFDTEDLKRTLEGEVAKRTGRDLVIAGDLSFSVFPWVAVEVSDLSLSNAPGFGDGPFVEIGRARAGVALLPLLRKEIYIDEVQLSDLQLDLVVNGAGTGNWEDLAAGAAEDGEPAGEGPFTRQQIAGLNVENARIGYRDERSGQAYRVSGFNLKTGALGVDGPVPLKLSLALEDLTAKSAYELALDAIVTPDLASQVYALDDLSLDAQQSGGPALNLNAARAVANLTSQVHTLDDLTLELRQSDGPTVNLRAVRAVANLATQSHTLDDLSLELQEPGGPAVNLSAARAVADMTKEAYTLHAVEATIDQDGRRIDVSAPGIRANLADQTLEMKDFSARTSGLDVTGSLGAGRILDAPTFTGSLRIAEFSPARLLRELDIEPPPTADPKVLQRATVKTDFEGDLDGIALENLALALDDSKLTGTLRVRDLDRPQIRFDLDVDRIDLDRYMAPAREGGGGAEDETAIPGQELKGLDVEGTLRVAELRAMGLDLSHAVVGLKVADNTLRLHPLTADFYGGTYSGDIGLDASGGVPVISMNEQIKAVVFQQLAGDLFGQDTVSGDGFGHVQLTGRGNTTGEVLRSLAGNLDLRLDEGALEGVNVWQEIRKAVALVKGQPAPEPAENRTVFSRMSLTASVQDGVMNLDELLGQLPFLDLSGGGSIDLASQALDLDLLAAVRSGPELGNDPLAAQLAGKRLPFTLRGPLTDPAVGLDVAGLLKGEATDKLVKKLGEKLGVESTEGDADSVEDVAAGLIGGLLAGKDKSEAAGPPQPAQSPPAPSATPQQTAEQAAADEAAAEADKEARRAARQDARKKARQEERTQEKEEQEEDEGG